MKKEEKELSKEKLLRDKLYEVKLKLTMLNSKQGDSLYDKQIEQLRQEEKNIKSELSHEKFRIVSEERKKIK